MIVLFSVYAINFFFIAAVVWVGVERTARVVQDLQG
jgi:hypothetical protein